MYHLVQIDKGQKPAFYTGWAYSERSTDAAAYGSIAEARQASMSSAAANAIVQMRGSKIAAAVQIAGRRSI